MNYKRAWANNELENLVRQLELALDATGVGIWQHNIAKAKTRWDERLIAIYGLPNDKDEVVWVESVHPDDLERVNAMFEDAVEKRLDHGTEFRIVRPDGEIRYLRSTARFFVDADGEPCFIGAELDITEDVLRNQELAKERALAQQRAEALDISRAAARQAADQDHLTGLASRRYFDETLGSLLRDDDIWLCHIDIDRFKEINDRFGHAGGDQVLRHVSDILKRDLQSDEIAARLGGDEFAILSFGRTEEEIGRVIANIRRALTSPLMVDDHALLIECSIGVATANKDDLSGLLSRSDIALYHAKRNGRNRTEIFSAAMAEQLAAERRVVEDIKLALKERRFIPFYQMQVDAKTRNICALEALARLDDPQKGIRAPAEFLDIATSYGLVDQIDDAILRWVLDDIHRWRKAGINVPRISVNISASRLADGALIDKLLELDLPQRALSFELVETIFLDGCDARIHENIQRLRALGIEVEIDDLGSGHASLLGLIELRPDRLKIDRQLVIPMLQSAAQRQLVKSIVDIAKALKIEVIAEGVESFEHADVLAELGVDLLQGYAYSRPKPAILTGKILQEGSASACAETLRSKTKQARARSA